MTDEQPQLPAPPDSVEQAPAKVEIPFLAPPADRFSTWFFRAVQIVGLLSFVYEVVVEHRDRPWILLVGLAMMLGGLGMQLMVRGFLAMVKGSGQQ